MKKPRSLPLATPIWLASALLVASLTGCASSGTQAVSAKVNPLERYREQAVEWKTCDSTILGSEEEWGDDPDEDPVVSNISIDDAKRKYGKRLRCASIRAPLDWANPDRGDVFISLLRLAAKTPDRKRGSLLFNPGGPGADGLRLAFAIEKTFIENGKPDHPERALHQRLVDEYDMVGFSPRGTGASTQLRCATNEMTHPLDYSREGSTPENIAHLHYNSSKNAEACLKNPLTPFINTDATARDLDLIRSLLGDDKLNFYGYSYGTWLGAWYANLFPERVGRMVLDSSVDFSQPFDAVGPAQPPARQRLLDEVLIPYAARHPEAFRLGRSAAEVRATLATLTPQMQHALVAPLNGTINRRESIEAFLTALSVGRDLDALFKKLPRPLTSAAVAQASQRLPLISGDAQRNALRRRIADIILDTYVGTWIRPERSSVDLSASDSTNHAVICSDTPTAQDVPAWTNQLIDTSRRTPLFWGVLSSPACPFWPASGIRKPDMAPMQALDVMLVQSQYDSATPVEGANAFFAQLPKAYRVYVPGELDHGVFPYEDVNCVDQTVARYLLDESPAQRETVCPAHPLPLDARKPQNRK